MQNTQLKPPSLPSDAERRAILARIVQVILDDPGVQRSANAERGNTDPKEKATR
jgi:hypothetical protein